MASIKIVPPLNFFSFNGSEVVQKRSELQQIASIGLPSDRQIPIGRRKIPIGFTPSPRAAMIEALASKEFFRCVTIANADRQAYPETAGLSERKA